MVSHVWHSSLLLEHLLTGWAACFALSRCLDTIIISLCGQSNLVTVHVAVQFASQLNMAAGKNWKRSSVSYETQVVLGKIASLLVRDMYNIWHVYVIHRY